MRSRRRDRLRAWPFRGVFSMLQDKLASTVAAVEEGVLLRGSTAQTQTPTPCLKPYVRQPNVFGASVANTGKETRVAVAPTNHARAITQIHTHRRNRHGSWRDGEGGALDALTLLESEVEGGADVAAPSESSKATPRPPAAALQFVSPEDISTADASPAAGHYAGALASLEDNARPEASHK